MKTLLIIFPTIPKNGEKREYRESRYFPAFPTTPIRGGESGNREQISMRAITNHPCVLTSPEILNQELHFSFVRSGVLARKEVGF